MKRFLPIVFLMISIMLCSCASGGIHESKEMNAFERIEGSLKKEYSDTNIHVLDSDSSKCIYYESKFESQDGQQRFVIKDLYVYNYDTGKINKLDFLTEEEKSHNSFICLPNDELLSIDPDHNICLLNSKSEVIATNHLQEMSFSNQKQGNVSVEIVFDVKSDGEYIYINGSDKANQNIVLVLDHNLKEEAVFYANAGWILISGNDNKIRLVDKKKNHMYEYIPDQNMIKDVGKTIIDVVSSSTCAGIVQGNEEYDYFYYTRGKYNKDNGLSEDGLIGIKGTKQEKIMDFSVMGIDDLYIEKIVSDEHDGFWIWGTVRDQEMVVYHFITMDSAKDYSAKSGKICCRIGRLQLPHDNVQGVMDQFCKESDDYYFETVVYQELYEDRDVAIMHLFLDCQNGKLDGVILDGIEEEFVKNDVLVDLQDYILQSKVVSKDKFITHYWESVTDSNGKIYAMYPSFTAIGYAYEEPINFSNLSKYLPLCEEKQPFLSTQGTDLDLGWLLTYSGNKFLDETTGELHVKTDEFKSILQFVKKQSECKPRNFDPVMQYCEGESLATRIRILEPCDYLYFNRLFHENVAFSNVCDDGLVIGEREGLIGICANTDKKEIFYNFYDYLFTPSVYHDFYFSGSVMPVLKEEYGLWKDYFLATEDYNDKYGKFNRKYEFRIGMGAAECVIDVGSITEKEADDAVRILQEVGYVKSMKEAYKQIIIEEATAYFSGGRDLDEVCDIMEKRLKNAMEENKGQ